MAVSWALAGMAAQHKAHNAPLACASIGNVGVFSAHTVKW
jgi:hypothetical protein